MVRMKGLLFLGAIALVFSAMGCSDDTGTDPPKTDGSTVHDSGPAPKIDCTGGNCKTYVFSRILLPTNTAEAKKYGYDYDNNSIKDNALGSILSGLGAAMQDFEMQPAIDTAVYSGEALLLLDVQAADLTTDPKAALQAFIGEKQACCAGQETNPDACKTAALAGCFSGSGVFAKAATSPTDAILGGAITGGEMAFGPAGLRIEIPFGTAGSLSINLREARIKGSITADGITDGVLSGVIPKADIEGSLIPAVAKMLQDIVADSTTKPDTKTQILGMFDADKDGTITTKEVAENSLIANFVGGDVDVDNDGEMELSLGIGFEAVKASFGTPTTPDAGAADTTVTPDAGVGDAPAAD
ncbi:MAG: hypothetical protein KAI47_12730 [Deltaproteobacteria bacterium]|nr:hypothetical protein [Deltaproteobacteria bacterium]